MIHSRTRALPTSFVLGLLAISCGKQGSEVIVAPAPAAAEPAQAAAETPPPEPPFAKVEGERGLRVHEPAALEGLTLISPLCSKSVHLVDMKGEPVHTWKTNHVPAGGVYFLPNGHLLRAVMVDDNPRFHGGGIGGRIEELDWDGKLVWEFELATDQRTTHHDIALLPNGNVLAIAWEYHSPEEIYAHGRDSEFVHEEGLWCDVVLEIKPKLPKGGEIVWSWRSFDHLVQDEREAAAGFGDPKDFPGRIDVNADHRYDAPETEAERIAREERVSQMQSIGYTGGKDVAKDAPKTPEDKAKPKSKHDADWLHTNAIDYLPEHDLIALSIPHMGEIWVIDHSTTEKEAAGSSGGRRGRGGELLYRYGNARNYGMGESSAQKLYYQHNATWQKGSKPGELSLLLFNNGWHRPEQEFSSAEELILPFDAESGFVREDGKAFGPDTLSWSYSDPTRLFSPFISGAQRLPNGNTLICEGARGRVLEVTREGNIVWDFYNPLGGEVAPAKQAGKAPAKALFRATRIAKDHPGLLGKI